MLVDIAVPPGGALIVNGQSFGKGWQASVDGASLGPPTPIDTQSGWRLSKPGHFLVDIKYGPQDSYEVGLAVSLCGVALSLYLALRRVNRPST